MIKILTDEDLKNLSPEDKAFLEGFCAATESAASLLYNLDVYQGNFDVDGVDINIVRFLENHEEVREALEVSLVHWMGIAVERILRHIERLESTEPINYTKDKKQTK